MGDMSQQGSLGDGGFDLSQFYSVFFEEAGENLASYESLLLAIDVESPDDEDLNAIFRAAHSIKGGSATFGFSDVAELTHELETLLDKVRKHELSLTATMVDILLESGDALKVHLGRHKAGGEGAVFDDASLKVRLRKLAAGQELDQSEQATTPREKLRELELIVGPLEDIAIAANIEEPFREIASLGKIEKVDFEPARSPGPEYVRYKILTLSSDEELLDLCNFYVSKEQMKMAPWPGAVTGKATESATAGSPQTYGFFEGAPGDPVQLEKERGYGFFEGAPGTTGAAPAASPDTATVANASTVTSVAVVPTVITADTAASKAPAAAKSGFDDMDDDIPF